MIEVQSLSKALSVYFLNHVPLGEGGSESEGEWWWGDRSRSCGSCGWPWTGRAYWTPPTPTPPPTAGAPRPVPPGGHCWVGMLWSCGPPAPQPRTDATTVANCCIIQCSIVRHALTLIAPWPCCTPRRYWQQADTRRVVAVCRQLVSALVTVGALEDAIKLFVIGHDRGFLAHFKCVCHSPQRPVTSSIVTGHPCWGPVD